MKKIYQVGPDIRLKGGISTVIRSISESNNINKMYQLHVIATTGESKISTFLKSIVNILKAKRGDIVHFHVASNGSFYRKYILYKIVRKNTKKVFHIHGGGFINFYKSANKLIKYFIKDMINQCDVIISVSNYMKNEIDLLFPSINSKSIKIYNGIDTGYNYISIDEKENIILFFGKLVEYKGIYDLLEVIENMKGFLMENNWKVVIAGNGEVDKVKNIITNKELSSVATVVGWIEGSKKEEILKKSKIIIIPSHVESFGIAAVEAMKYGNSVICTNVGALPEIIKDDINGFVVEKGNILKMEEKIKFAIGNKEMIKKMCCSNIVYSKNFSVEEMINNYIIQYEDL